MRRKFITIFLPLLVLAGLVLIFTSTDSKNNAVTLSPSIPHTLSFSGSLGSFDVQNGIDSFKINVQFLDTLSLFWYKLNSDGSISRSSQVTAEVENELLTFAKRNSTEIFFGIENDEDNILVDNLLTSTDLRKQHIVEVLMTLSERDFDGVIVDYENLRQDQTMAFMLYIKELAAAVRAQGKLIGVSAMTELSGRVFHGIDIVEVSKLVDRLELQTYEEFGQETGPGPIASIDWVETIITNAIKQGVSPEKIIIGTAHAGHDWIISPSEEFVSDETARKALSVLSLTGSKLMWDKESKSNFFEYKDSNGSKHIVWIEDEKSFENKIELAKRYRLQGVFIWYLGAEDPNMWEVLRKIKQ